MAAKLAKQRWVVVLEDVQATRDALYNAMELRDELDHLPFRIVSAKKEKK